MPLFCVCVSLCLPPFLPPSPSFILSSFPPFFSPSPSLSLLPLPSPLHHTQKPLFKGAFFQLTEVKSLPLCGEGSLTFPQQHLFKDFTFVTLWRGQKATVERGKREKMVNGGGQKKAEEGREPSFHNKASKEDGKNRKRQVRQYSGKGPILNYPIYLWRFHRLLRKTESDISSLLSISQKGSK